MKVFRVIVFSFALLGLLALESAEGAIKKPLKKKAPVAAKTNTAPTSDSSVQDVFTSPLIAADVLAKLKLTADQKPDADKVFKEFNLKLKEIAAKAQADKSAPATAAKAKGKGAAKGGDSPNLTAALTLRDDYDDKFVELLTEAQKKTLDDIRAKMGEGLLNPGGKTAPKTQPKK